MIPPVVASERGTAQTIQMCIRDRMDIGIWLLSDRAVSLLVKRSYKEGKLSYYDMYSDIHQKKMGLH